eukprot:CAMPEP_0117423860 /NCGR_PEP_ID=MMETSP0758-20121206/4394_1 /TAXON_ID=63605 /ORGANISM="Percolomonas cosmopolitus, Strain AE-1 (ATCC 50343)" /LENGTH=469 /DNA_ID=CAMNT_0005207291 /DNA_START=154 /DNA_END=1563 /DNA_ORIENTATION=-
MNEEEKEEEKEEERMTEEELEEKVDDMIDSLKGISNVTMNMEEQRHHFSTKFEEFHNLIVKYQHKRAALYMASYYIHLMSFTHEQEHLQQFINIAQYYINVAYDPDVEESVLYKLKLTPDGEEREKIIKEQLKRKKKWIYSILAEKEEDPQQKISILKKGGDDPVCLLDQATLLVSLHEEPENNPEIIELLEKVIKQKDSLLEPEKGERLKTLYASACSQLGMLTLQTGNVEKAIDLLKEAAEFNEPNSFYFLGRCALLQNKEDEALSYFRDGMKAMNNPNCSVLVLQFHAQNKHQLTEDELAILERDAQIGDVRVLYALSTALLNNHISAKLDSENNQIRMVLPEKKEEPSKETEQLAMNLIEMGVQKKDLLLKDLLTSLLFTGTVHMPPNLSRAITLTQEILQDENELKDHWPDIIATAHYNLGIAKYTGQGLDKDEQEGKEHLNTASSLGSKLAKNALAHIEKQAS